MAWRRRLGSYVLRGTVTKHDERGTQVEWVETRRGVLIRPLCECGRPLNRAGFSVDEYEAERSDG